jgi:von Willebrand factor type A domain
VRGIATPTKPALFALLVLGALALLPYGAAGSAHAAPSCTQASDIEAIIDDSGSMSVTDDNRLRVQAMDLLINALNPGTTLGAVEFGSGDDFSEPPKPGADSVFNPEPVGPNASAMKSALDTLIQADNGATDYNAAFKAATAANPGAKARIFLTDGGHDEGAYENAHLSTTSPVYVIGFSPGLADPEDQARLQQIASDTGGRYFPLADSSQLQPVMDTIETILTCQTAPQTFEDPLAQGQSKVHSVAIGAASAKVQIAISWASGDDSFKVGGLQLISKGVVLAAGRPKVRKLQVKRSAGKTFVVLKISGLRPGRLRFKVKAARVASASKAVLTTQISEARRR